jgi:hypothetical protein
VRQRWRRLAEFAPALVFAGGLIHRIVQLDLGSSYPEEPSAADWWWTVTLGAWSLASVILRPLTAELPPWKRAAVIVLIAGAALSWLFWVEDGYSRARAGVLLSLGLVDCHR